MATKKTTKKEEKRPIKINKQSAQFDRLPPQNIEAEQAVLGSLMLDKDAVVKISDILKPEDFYRGAHQFILDSYFSCNFYCWDYFFIFTGRKL